MIGQERAPAEDQVFTASVMLNGSSAPPPGGPYSTRALDAVEDALVTGDAAAMLRAWHVACLDALGSQRWEPMLAVGDAAWRIGQATGLKIAFAAKARQAYHVALYRAHKQGTVAGVQRVGEAFAALGEREAVEQWPTIAAQLGGDEE